MVELQVLLGLFLPVLHRPAGPQIFIGYLPCPFQHVSSTAVQGGAHATETILSKYTRCAGHDSYQSSLQKMEDQSIPGIPHPQINLF